MSFARSVLAMLSVVAAGVMSCAPPDEPIAQNAQPLCGPGGCCTLSGAVDSTMSADGNYYLTSFGGGGFAAGCSYDTQSVACGGRQADGCWYYAADRQRWGCNARLRLTRPDAPTRCVVVQVVDTGPDACVETAAGKRVIDASPVVAHALFTSSCLGWSDARVVHVDVVPAGTPLGPCEQHGECASAPASPRAGSATGVWTCSSDSSARARCVDNENIECEPCSGGCAMHAAPTDSVCRAGADAGVADASNDAGSDVLVDALVDAAQPEAGDSAPTEPDVANVSEDATSEDVNASSDVATGGDARCDGRGDAACGGVTSRGGCACRTTGGTGEVPFSVPMMVAGFAFAAASPRRRRARVNG